MASSSRGARAIAKPRPVPVRVYTPVALKLHSFGLSRMLDPEWCGEDFYQHFKRPYRGQAEPAELFKKTLRDGFLHHLGLFLLQDYLWKEDWFESLDVEQEVEYLDDLAHLLIQAGVPDNDKYVSRTHVMVGELGELLGEDDDAYYELVEHQRTRRRLMRVKAKLVDVHSDAIAKAIPVYADNYANRVFHDRELCGYLATLILNVGFDGTGMDEPPSQWVKRLKLPEWAKNAVRARDRGRCASCGCNMAMELDADAHYDHIVPITRGGCNDLVNFQLLCQICNTKKQNNQLPVTSSIPPYMRRGSKPD